MRILIAMVSVMWMSISCSYGANGGGDMDAFHSKIRFYTGNLSVGHFMQYWGTGGALPTDVPTTKFCDDMKSVSVSAVCDYLGWACIEPEQGKLDWSFYDNNARILHENGLQYNVFCWLHFAPEWFRKTPDYVPYRCVEHDQPIEMTSIWAPGTLKAYDHFYKELAAHFGDKIAFLRLATPSEYGEVGYPNGMTNWLVKQQHAHTGFWCNDRYARADFRAKMKKRYGSIKALDDAWGRSYGSFEAIEYPAVARDSSKFVEPLQMKPGERRWILDFIGWYYDSQSEFVRKAVSTVRKYFPGKEIILSMGYGSQLTAYGNDDVGISRTCRDLKISCQTPGNVDYICMKSLATPCHYYGVPYFTEPPAGMNRIEEIKRIWSDASCGVQTYFDYPDNLLGAKDAFIEYGGCLDGKRPVVDIAVLFPTTDHRLTSDHWPGRTLVGVNVLREIVDYDLVDERLVRDGALKGYKMLLAYDGNVVDARTLPVLEKWLNDGGVLLVRDFGRIETIEGDKDFYDRVFPRPTTSVDGQYDIGKLLSDHAKRVGKGWVIVIPSKPGDEADFARTASELGRDLTGYLGAKRDVIVTDAQIDGVLTTLFPDKILLMNFTDKPVDKVLKLRESDFSDGRLGRPAKLDYTLHMPAHSIQSIPLEVRKG